MRRRLPRIRDGAAAIAVLVAANLLAAPGSDAPPALEGVVPRHVSASAPSGESHAPDPAPSRHSGRPVAFAPAIQAALATPIPAPPGGPGGPAFPLVPARRRVSPAARRPREWTTRRRLQLLESTGILRREGEPFEIAGVTHTPYQVRKRGLPVLNRRGRIHEQGASLWGIAGGVSFPPIVSDAFAVGRDTAVGIAREAAGVHALRAAPRVQIGWFAQPGGTVAAWQVELPSRIPLASFQVTVDAGTGEVLALLDRLRTKHKKGKSEPPADPDAGTGYVFDPNPVESPTQTPVPLRALDEGGLLRGDVTRVIDERAIEAYEPGKIFAYPPGDPRLVQTSVYRNLTDTGLFAVQSGFPPFASPVPAFTNLADPESGAEFNNAFYDPSIPAFGFGNGDDVLLANLGTDRDVAAHEMGHHVFEVLVAPIAGYYEDPVLAMHEAVADTFAALLGGNADIGESTVPGAPFLRTLENDAQFPDDWHPDPHVTGLIYAGANWDINTKKMDLGKTLVAGLPFLPPDAIETEYRDAILLGDAAVSGGRFARQIRAAFSRRGFDVMEIPPEFQGWVTDGVVENGFLPDSTFDSPRYHYYFFSEFPGSTQIRFETSGSGDVDLLVAPWNVLDPSNPSTYRTSETVGSNETIVVNAATVPSVHWDDLWLVLVQDFPDFRSSNYTLSVTATLPADGVSVDGPPVAGSITQLGEIDYFTFSGSAGQVVRVEAHDVNGTLDPLAVVFTPNDVELLAFDDDSGPGTDSLIQGVMLPYSGQFGVAVLSLLADVDPTVGTGPYNLTLSTCVNTGPDGDLDGLVDACDDDDDNDGFTDAEDVAPADPSACIDLDQDGCNDCSSGAFDWLNDGPDADDDGVCDAGDEDDDNDGCEDPDDIAPLIPSTDPDLDLLGADCDNCPDVPNPGQADANADGLGDACTACSRVAWTEPPLDPPDQNPAGSAIALLGLEPAGTPALAAYGGFNPAAAPAVDPATSGAYLRLADWGGLLFEIEVPPGAPGSGCGPNDGWTGAQAKKGGFTWTYLNESNALPAAGCAPGSAGGLTALSLSEPGTELGYQVEAEGVALLRQPAEPVRFLQLDLVLGSGLANGFPSTEGNAGMCAESVLWVGGPTSSCAVSEAGGSLSSIECGESGGKKGKKKKKK